MNEHDTNREAVASVPDVSFVPFGAMPLQECAQFVLKANLSMMLFLICDISFDLLQVRFAYRKIGISTLALKNRKPVALFQPKVRYSFQFLDPFRLSDCAAKTREQMHMILYAACPNRRTSECLRDAANLCVQCYAY